MRLQQFDNAFADFNKALELQPENPSALFYRAMLYSRMGKYREQLADLDRLIAIHPESAEMWNNRCFTRARLGIDLELALADCNKALSLRPENAPMQDSRGFVEFRMNNYTAAISDFNSALGKDAKLSSSLYVRGLAKRRNGDTTGGDADIAAAKAIDPKMAETYAGYGVAP
jgi:tetratricopeptide (TPR) repeat protein